MSDPLTTYLQDHLAGALQAIELLKAMSDGHAGEPLGQFATNCSSRSNRTGTFWQT